MSLLKTTGFLFCLALGAFLPAVVLAARPVYFIFQQKDAATYQFDGGFDAEVDPQTAWEVLTDYNHISDFVSNMRSHVLKRQGNDLLIDQTAGGGFLFINMTVQATLLIHEEPMRAIYLQDIEHKNFADYEGVWTLAPETGGPGVQVTYHLDAQRNLQTPDFLTADLFCGSLGDLLTEMRREMKRRQAKIRQEPTPSPGPPPTEISPPHP